jgi:hypothetical protein
MSTSTPTAVEAPAAADKLMQDYALAEAKLQQAKDEMKPIRAALLAMFPSDAGEYEMKAGKWVLSVDIPDKVVWNADELAAHYGASVPPYVKRNFYITETDFKRLPTEEREQLAGARDFKTGTPRIDLAVAK